VRTHRTRFRTTVQSFLACGCDDAAARLVASAQHPPIAAAVMDGRGGQHRRRVDGIAGRFKKMARSLRSNPDRLRLLEAAASDALRQYRSTAMDTHDPELLSWSTFALEQHAEFRWSQLLLGDRIEELSLHDGDLPPVSRTGIVHAVRQEGRVLALTVAWDDGPTETLLSTSGRSIFHAVGETGVLSTRMTPREGRRRRRTVRRLRIALVSDKLRPREKLIEHVAAETPVHSLLDRSIERAMPVILYATTERVLWAGYDGSYDYEARRLGHDGHMRGVDLGCFLDMVAAPVGEGPRGSLPGPGFGFIAFTAKQADALSPGVVEGLTSVRELEIWAMEVAGTDDAGHLTAGLAGMADGEEFFQLFHFPAWVPAAVRVVATASERNAASSR